MTPNTHHPDKRWRRLVDANNAGEYLPPEDRDFLIHYRSASAEIEVERSLLDKVCQIKATPSSNGQDDRIIANVVDRWHQEHLTRAASGLPWTNLWRRFRRPQGIRWFHYAGTIGTSIAALAMWWFLDEDRVDPLIPREVSSPSSISSPSNNLYLMSGRAIINNRTIVAKSPIALSSFPSKTTQFEATQALCIGSKDDRSSSSDSSEIAGVQPGLVPAPSSAIVNTAGLPGPRIIPHPSLPPSQLNSHICFT